MIIVINRVHSVKFFISNTEVDLPLHVTLKVLKPLWATNLSLAPAPDPFTACTFKKQVL